MVSFADATRNDENHLLRSVSRELEVQLAPPRYDQPDGSFGAKNSLPEAESAPLNLDKRDSSNLQGASAFMPIGVTPREDELALIESLARN